MKIHKSKPTLTQIILSLLVIVFVVACQTEAEPETEAEPTEAVVPTDTPKPEPTDTPAPTAIPTTTPITPPDPIPVSEEEGWELVWSDEFEGDAIDPNNWTYELGGWGWGNGEAQNYTDRPENARVENGMLIIEARQEKYQDSYYTSARLVTQDLHEFQYGRIEARIKVPDGVGTWPAFWMLGSDFSRDEADPFQSNWPNAGEIDIMEYVGRDPDKVVGTIHGPGYAGAGGLTRWNRVGFPIADDFHTFAIEWDENGIRWFFDGEMYYDLTPDSVGDREWVFDQPFFIIVNLALGGTLGGTIALDTQFPQVMYVDYVRVYQTTADSTN